MKSTLSIPAKKGSNNPMKPSPIITGAFAFRPLEMIAWLLIIVVFVSVVFIRRGGEIQPPQNAFETSRIDLNSAPLDELLTLPGMTKRRAEAITTARAKRGGFERVGDIASVPGISSGYVRRIESMVEARRAGIGSVP